MKSFAILTALLLSAPLCHAYSADAVKAAEKLHKLTEERFRVGEVTRTDIRQTAAFLVKMKFEAGQISKAEYCSELLPGLLAALDGVREEEKVGQRTIVDVIEAEIEYYKNEAFCK